MVHIVEQAVEDYTKCELMMDLLQQICSCYPQIWYPLELFFFNMFLLELSPEHFSLKKKFPLEKIRVHIVRIASLAGRSKQSKH